METLTPVATGPFYAAVVETSTKRISINTDLKWCYHENRYKNISDVEKVQRQTIKASTKNKKQNTERNEQDDPGIFRFKKVEYCGARPQSYSVRKRHQIKQK